MTSAATQEKWGYHAAKAVVLELPELEQRLSNLQSQVERLWRKAETSVPPIEQRLASMADQYAEYLKRWAVTVERHTHAVAQLEAYASEWKDASSQLRQRTADRLQELESTIDREWDTLKQLQEDPIRQLREQADSLTRASLAMTTASQQSLERAEARFASFESEVHLRLNELTMELQSALAEMRARLDRQGAPRDASAQWSLDDVTRLHGQLRDGSRGPGDFPRTIDHPSAGARQFLTAGADSDDAAASNAPRHASASNLLELPVRWVTAVAILGIVLLLTAIFAWRMQSQARAAAENERLNNLKHDAIVNDVTRQAQAARQEAQQQIQDMQEASSRAQRTFDILAAPDLLRFNLSGPGGASGQALFSRSRGFAVNGSRVPLPPAGTVYRAWLLTRTTPVKMGILRTQADGTLALAEPLPNIPRAVVGVRVTCEPASSGDEPTGDDVLSSVVQRVPAPPVP